MDCDFCLGVYFDGGQLSHLPLTLQKFNSSPPPPTSTHLVFNVRTVEILLGHSRVHLVLGEVLNDCGKVRVDPVVLVGDGP